ncbi:Protein of unknown function [Halobacillus karajensis]|uniref:DUF3892 domain-containing protein n=1 Tax=Halobacillus karajensis TaxID=195088 RepID=A0A024P5X0_9BACI|nr:DUF3892 domain-containing protein [Halobacillus karajensis]CDQ17859.1 hypothetical protein BN982_00097 [Halobacillus karajensis]CDQ24265.1 hypothetical protein BN983_02537 [Halobacillus karajensis]CDQ29486.1 hypothetical protein BN981_03869 [Halobacillus karajensis]SEH62662.1 Protein of unknown function [Halobacillus karajensis]
MPERIVAVRKNGQGSITEMQLSSGQVIDYKRAHEMARSGELEHVNLIRGKDGDQHLRSEPDGIQSNNLDNLPSF